MTLFKKNVILILLAVCIAVIPLVTLKDAEFAGADGLAEEAITQINPEYEPWFNSVIELPSGEVESLLFSLQAAIGSGIIFFIIGRMTARKPKEGKNDTK